MMIKMSVHKYETGKTKAGKDWINLKTTLQLATKMAKHNSR